MKRIFTLLLAGMLWLPTTTRAQDAEALGALVGVLKDVDDPAFQLDILKGIADALKGLSEGRLSIEEALSMLQ